MQTYLLGTTLRVQCDEMWWTHFYGHGFERNYLGTGCAKDLGKISMIVESNQAIQAPQWREVRPNTNINYEYSYKAVFRTRLGTMHCEKLTWCDMFLLVALCGDRVARDNQTRYMMPTATRWTQVACGGSKWVVERSAMWSTAAACKNSAYACNEQDFDWIYLANMIKDVNWHVHVMIGRII